MSLNEKIIKIPVKKIIESNIYQKEIPLSELELLKKSILANGLINPIIVKRSIGKYLLISGKKRLEAVKLAKIEDISAIILDCNNSDAVIISLAECFNDENEYIKHSILIKYIQNEYKLSPLDLANRIGTDENIIIEKLKYNDFSKIEIKMLITGKISENQAKLSINFIGDLRTKFIYYMMYKKLNFEQSKELFDKINENKEKPIKKPKNKIVDNRIILNTIKNSVNTMKKFGIEPIIDTNESEKYTEYIVKIPKNQPTLSLIS